MVIKIVYFDWGDVLGGNGDPQLFAHLTETFDLPRSDIDRIVSEELTPFFKGKIGQQAFWDAVCDRVSYRGDRVSFDELFERFYHAVLFPREDVLDVAARVRERGILTGILSNMVTPLAQFCRQRNYFASFDHVVVSSEVGYMKPEKWIYATALEQAALTDESTVLFVDNNPAYLTAAQRFGFRAVLYDNRKDSINVLEDQLRNAGVLP